MQVKPLIYRLHDGFVRVAWSAHTTFCVRYNMAIAIVGRYIFKIAELVECEEYTVMVRVIAIHEDVASRERCCAQVQSNLSERS